MLHYSDARPERGEFIGDGIARTAGNIPYNPESDDNASSPDDEFWNSRESLQQIKDYAVSRFVSPYAVLAVTLLNVSNGYTAMGGGLLLSCVNGFSAGVGFGLALILFCGVRKALEHAKPPKCFEGLPITLVAAALTSMTFMGFAGMADKLFG